MSNVNPIEIENAGLVLLAPFLPHCFRNLGFLDGMRFANEETHAKAMRLLQFMADQEHDAKGDWSLNALLCGWPIGQPVPPFPALSAVEKAQANQVVEAMRAHWVALGDYSSDDLRRLFLRRRGLLDVGMPSILRVQPQPLDKLLRELPWIFAVTRTPWSEAIDVQWDN
ncbi:MAG: contractile injection system tape measure protein [Betaproteobacteria bacterium]|nr:contractile injection system tape measure protein [Betaproteobacteria bacterium]